MSKLYSLEKLVSGDYPVVDIGFEKFKAIKESKETLSAVLRLEELFELIIRGYIDIEANLYRLALERSLRFDFSYDDIFEISLQINKLLVGFLTSVRLYLDTSPIHAAKTSKNPKKILALAKTLASHQYDEKFEYRFMEQFRNHIQHYGLGVHSTAQGSTYDFEKESRLFYLKLTSFKQSFLKDKRFKKAVLEECEDKIDVFSYVKVYMSSLVKIHEGLRNEITLSVDCARRLIEVTLKEYQTGAQEINGHVSLVTRNNKSGEVEERLDIFLDWDDIRVKLQRLNRSIGKVEARTISLH